jgi:hypothetical protein
MHLLGRGLVAVGQAKGAISRLLTCSTPLAVPASWRAVPARVSNQVFELIEHYVGQASRPGVAHATVGRCGVFSAEGWPPASDVERFVSMCFRVVRARRTFWRGSVPTLPQDAPTVLPDFQHVFVATQRDRLLQVAVLYQFLSAVNDLEVAVSRTRSVYPSGASAWDIATPGLKRGPNSGLPFSEMNAVLFGLTSSTDSSQLTHSTFGHTCQNGSKGDL